MSNKLINIEVAYALPTKQAIVDVAIHENATVEEAIFQTVWACACIGGPSQAE